MTGSLQAKKLPSGKQYYYARISYTDPLSGKVCHKCLATGLEVKNNKRRAEAVLKDMMEANAYLENPPKQIDANLDPDITLNDYLDRWLAGKKRDLKEDTYEGYEYRVKRIRDYFKKSNPRVVDVNPKMLDTFFRYALNYGKINQKTHAREPLSVRSVRSYKSILYAMFNQAIIDGFMTANPAASVQVHGKKNKAYSEEMLFMTEDEVADLLHFMAERYPRLLPITFMGAYYGLRRSEILGLKWSAIDFRKKTICIEHTVVRVKTVTAEDAVKTEAGRRTLNLFPMAEKCLLSVKAEQDENRQFFGNTYQNTDGYVFTWEDGTAYDPNYISGKFKKAVTEFGRPELSLHKLRHSCASMLINKGWDLKKLQYWLGHSDASTTLNIYSHFNKQRLNTSVNDLAEISEAAGDIFA